MYHGAVITHAGAEGVRVFEETAQLGRELENLSEVAGTVTQAKAAVIYDWETGWAHDIVRMPLLSRFPYLSHAQAWHSAFWKEGVAVDVVDQTADLSSYQLIVLPASFKLRPGFAEALRDFVHKGGVLIATCLTGHVDDDLLAYDGGAPGPLRDILGLSVHEVDALHPEETAWVEWGGRRHQVASVCELAVLEGAECLGAFRDRFYEGGPAITRHRFGKGTAYWVGADLDAAFCHRFMRSVDGFSSLDHAVDSPLPEGVSATRRGEGDSSFLFILNANPHEVEVSLEGWRSHQTGKEADGLLRLSPHDVQVMVKSRAAVPSVALGGS